MEAVAALGVASAVVQLVDFTKRLLGDASEIYKSGEAASEDNLQLEQICEPLAGISNEISTCNGQLCEQTIPTGDALTVKELALACKQDCDKLKTVLQGIRVSGSGGLFWRSLKAAVRNAGVRGQVEELQGRVLRAQATLTLCSQRMLV
jgi:hypothetical protein